jgi:Flp pilus assembly protein TadD
LYREEAEEYRKSADAGNVRAVNGLGWLLATCADSEVRDGRDAVTFAQKAVSATNRKDPSILDTLAAAYAEAGQFAKAVSVQNEAIGLNQDATLKEGMTKRLKLYESNSPYREP